jgi:hypothetical protein
MCLLQTVAFLRSFSRIAAFHSANLLDVFDVFGELLDQFNCSFQWGAETKLHFRSQFRGVHEANRWSPFLFQRMHAAARWL